MTAKKNDDARIAEVYRVIQETYKRIDAIEITEQQFLNAKTPLERTIVDGIHLCVYRVAEEAGNLEFDTMRKFPTIPWDAIRGMRNRIAHDYSNTSDRYTWQAIIDDFPVLESVCLEYAASHPAVDLVEKVPLGKPQSTDALND